MNPLRYYATDERGGTSLANLWRISSDVTGSWTLRREKRRKRRTQTDFVTLGLLSSALHGSLVCASMAFARFSYEVDAGLGQFAGPGQKPVAHVAHVAVFEVVTQLI